MKKILLSATIHRVGERIYPIIPKLSEQFSIDVVKTSQMGNNFDWYGDVDFRNIFEDKYKSYCRQIMYDLPDVRDYDLILFDDCRPRNNLNKLGSHAKINKIPTLAHYEGNGYLEQSGANIVQRDSQYWDKISLFGKKDVSKYLNTGFGSEFNFVAGGIPSNDKLAEYENTQKHILVIVNFLGNRQCPFKVTLNEKFIDDCGLVDLQNQFNKKIIFKLKSRKDNPKVSSDINYLKQIVDNKLDYEIIMDCEDDNKLICDSEIVISSPSTLAFKSIQKGIPTILVKNSGLDGSFSDYKGLVDLNKKIIFEELERQIKTKKDVKFIKQTIEGGLNFNSSDIYINNIRRMINED